MNALIFVESPLQVLNAMEAINFFKIKTYKVIVRLSGFPRSDFQLLKTLMLLSIDSKCILTVKIKVLHRSIVDLLKVFFYSKRYMFSTYDFVFIGNAESGFFKQIKNQLVKRNKIVYLDDGTKSLVRSENNEECEFFSVFNVSDQLKPLNQYSYLKSMMRHRECFIQKNEILFLGQKLSEIGMLSQSEYISLVKKFALSYSEYRVIYILHRGENAEKLAEISQISNVDILELDYPIELYALCNKTIPFKVASFYSTALYTMKIIYGIEAESISIEVDDLGFKKKVDVIYNFYSESGIVRHISHNNI